MPRTSVAVGVQIELGELAPKGDWCGRDALTSGFVERAIVVLESEQHD